MLDCKGEQGMAAGLSGLGDAGTPRSSGKSRREGPDGPRAVLRKKTRSGVCQNPGRVPDVNPCLKEEAGTGKGPPGRGKGVRGEN